MPAGRHVPPRQGAHLPTPCCARQPSPTCPRGETIPTPLLHRENIFHISDLLCMHRISFRFLCIHTCTRAYTDARPRFASCAVVPVVILSQSEPHASLRRSLASSPSYARCHVVPNTLMIACLLVAGARLECGAEARQAGTGGCFLVPSGADQGPPGPCDTGPERGPTGPQSSPGVLWIARTPPR